MGRIIAGRAKGTRILAPKGDATRPTTDRVREALFSALVTWFDTADEAPGEQLEGVRVLDLFAGSGAVGLEAASRGAARVLAVDNRTAGIIRDNAARTGLRVEVASAKAEAVVTAAADRFDLVFIDPPYDFTPESVNRLLALLIEHGRLASESLVVVERSKRSAAPSWPDGFTRTWRRDYGETTLHFGAFEGEENA